MTFRTCHCGCDRFRFKSLEAIKDLYSTELCKNCNHSLADHLPLVRSKQAE